VGDVAVVIHFEVDTDAPVDAGAWTMDIEICHAAFHDFSEDFPCALVDGDSDSGLVARVEVLTDDGGQVGGGDFVECIAFLLVCV
jgi:hypothetical protein